jgi:hypothetical protein
MNTCFDWDTSSNDMTCTVKHQDTTASQLKVDAVHREQTQFTSCVQKPEQYTTIENSYAYSLRRRAINADIYLIAQLILFPSSWKTSIKLLFLIQSHFSVSDTYFVAAILVAWWSEFLTTNNEVTGSIPGSAVGIFPCRGRCP